MDIIYIIPVDFILTRFLDTVRASGVPLERTEDTPNPVGRVTLSGLKLWVSLDTFKPEQKASVDAAILAQGGSEI